LIDELTYRSYKYNRERSPEIPARQWKVLFTNADIFEQKLQIEKDSNMGISYASQCEICYHVGTDVHETDYQGEKHTVCDSYSECVERKSKIIIQKNKAVNNAK
jgi:hypothetical protein